MKKLDNSFIDAITKEYEEKHLPVINEESDSSIKKLLRIQAKESAYVFTLCINKLIDEDFFKS